MIYVVEGTEIVDDTVCPIEFQAVIQTSFSALTIFQLSFLNILYHLTHFIQDANRPTHKENFTSFNKCVLVFALPAKFEMVFHHQCNKCHNSLFIL